MSNEFTEVEVTQAKQLYERIKLNGDSISEATKILKIGNKTASHLIYDVIPNLDGVQLEDFIYFLMAIYDAKHNSEISAEHIKGLDLDKTVRMAGLYLDGKPMDEVASEFGVSLGEVSFRISSNAVMVPFTLAASNPALYERVRMTKYLKDTSLKLKLARIAGKLKSDAPLEETLALVDMNRETLEFCLEKVLPEMNGMDSVMALRDMMLEKVRNNDTKQRS